MARGGDQPLEVAEEVVFSNEGLGTVRSKHACARDLLQGSGTGGYYLCFVDVVDDPRMRRDLGGLHNRVSQRIMVR